MSAFINGFRQQHHALVEGPADADRSTAFSTGKELAKLVGEWPISRLIDAWSRVAGVAPFQELKPIKKFTDRKSAVARVWAAIQRLSPGRCENGARRGAREEKSKKFPAKPPRRERARPTSERSNKKAEVIAIMKRVKGATPDEIMGATGWQKHTVRGFVSILGSKGVCHAPDKTPH